jgi:hypothetical protein
MKNQSYRIVNHRGPLENPLYPSYCQVIAGTGNKQAKYLVNKSQIKQQMHVYSAAKLNNADLKLALKMALAYFAHCFQLFLRP